MWRSETQHQRAVLAKLHGTTLSIERIVNSTIDWLESRESRIASHDASQIEEYLQKLPERRGRCHNCGAVLRVGGPLGVYED